jgi:hypothetical protein
MRPARIEITGKQDKVECYNANKLSECGIVKRNAADPFGAGGNSYK